jgi:hypothetical protein
MNTLEETDKEEEGLKEPSADDIRAALERLKARKIKFEELNSRLQSESEISTVDPDSRRMRCAGDAREFDVCYNVHTVVDSKNCLIVDFDLTNCSNDYGNLNKMSENAMDIMGVTSVTNLADKGYYDSKDIAACERNGITCLVAKPKPGGAKKAKGFTRDNFIYDPEKDVYICPCKKELRFMCNRKHISGREYRAYRNTLACGKCPKKPECTKYRYREVLRLTSQDVLDRLDERTRNNKALYRKRQEIVEHPFGTIKAIWGFRQFLCRTKPNVTAETSLACLAYNFRRAINIFAKNGVKLKPALV